MHGGTTIKIPLLFKNKLFLKKTCKNTFLSAYGFLSFCFSSNIIKLDKYIQISNSEPTVTLQNKEIYLQKFAQFLVRGAYNCKWI
jgi:hypothetical protein